MHIEKDFEIFATQRLLIQRIFLARGWKRARLLLVKVLLPLVDRETFSLRLLVICQEFPDFFIAVRVSDHKLALMSI